MFDHVLLNVANKIESMKFYTPVLQVLSIKILYDQNEYSAYGIDSFHFWLHESKSEEVTRKCISPFRRPPAEMLKSFIRRRLQREENQMEHPDFASMAQNTTRPMCSTLRATI